MDTKNNRSFFQFSKPELTESIFVVNEDFVSNKPKEQKIKLEAKVSEINKKDKQNTASVELTVSNFKEFKITEETPYLLRVTMKSNFVWEEDLDSSEVNNLLRINGSSFLLSYIRPFISEMTGLSKFKREYLPFIDFTNSTEVNKK